MDRRSPRSNVPFLANKIYMWESRGGVQDQPVSCIGTRSEDQMYLLSFYIIRTLSSQF